MGFCRQMAELINILIRTSNRPELFRRALKSITDQSYPNIRIIICYDNQEAIKYIPSGLESFYIPEINIDRGQPYYYDAYCNLLKERVTDGWFMFLDDDDYLMPDVLTKMTLDAPAILHQLQRRETIVPTGLDFKRGLIGMPCLMLHHTLKCIANIPGTGQGDYFWIKAVMDKVGLSFRPLIVVGSDGRGLGKC